MTKSFTDENGLFVGNLLLPVCALALWGPADLSVKFSNLATINYLVMLKNVKGTIKKSES